MKTRDYSLTEAELKELGHIIRTHKRAEVVQRATGVRMMGLGQTSAQVAGQLAVTPATVRNWFTRWQEGGVQALVNRPKAGRPRQATEAYWQVIADALESAPSRFGYTFTIWTLVRLRDHAEQQTGIHLHANYLSEQMKRHGYVYRRPKHDLAHKQDAQARDAAAVALEGLKKTPKRGISHSASWTKAP